MSSNILGNICHKLLSTALDPDQKRKFLKERLDKSYKKKEKKSRMGQSTQEALSIINKPCYRQYNKE